jgi:hypothetical protein
MLTMPVKSGLGALPAEHLLEHARRRTRRGNEFGAPPLLRRLLLKEDQLLLALHGIASIPSSNRQGRTRST